MKTSNFGYIITLVLGLIASIIGNQAFGAEDTNQWRIVPPTGTRPIPSLVVTPTENRWEERAAIQVAEVRFAKATNLVLVTSNYTAQPAFSGDFGKVIDNVTIYWPKSQMMLSVDFQPETGVIKGFRVHTVYYDEVIEAPEVVYEAGKDSAVEAASWINFALKVRGEFQPVGGDGIYAEVRPYRCVGVTQWIQTRELPVSLSTIILERDGFVTALPATSWAGNVPKVGEEVYLARGHYSEGEESFFQVARAGGRFFVPPELAGKLVK